MNPQPADRQHLPPLAASAIAAVAIAALLVLFIDGRFARSFAPPPEKLTIAVPRQIASGNVIVAHVKGLFTKHGLDVTLQEHTLGREALAAVTKGKADLALVADTPYVFAVLRGEPVTLLGSVHSSGKYNVIVARRDRQVSVPSDLAGKKVGLPFGTSMDFFKDAYLSAQRVPTERIEFIDLQANELTEALVSGRVDAVVTFPPQSIRLRRALGDRGVIFTDPAVYLMTFNVVGSLDLVKNRSGAVKKLFQALVEAAEFVRNHPQEAREIVTGHLKLDTIEETAEVWDDSDFSVSLSQSLLIALEDQSAWAIRRNLTGASKVPDFLDHIYSDGLDAVRPGAVTLVR